MTKAVRVTLTCPVCKTTNLIPVKSDTNTPQSFECLECQTQFTILKPELLGYIVSQEKKEKKGRVRRGLTDLINDFVLWWLLRR